MLQHNLTSPQVSSSVLHNCAVQWEALGDLRDRQGTHVWMKAMTEQKRSAHESKHWKAEKSAHKQRAAENDDRRVLMNKQSHKNRTPSHTHLEPAQHGKHLQREGAVVSVDAQTSYQFDCLPHLFETDVMDNQKGH